MSSSLDDRGIVEGCRAGDPRAMDALYRAHCQRVERVIFRLVGPSPDLEDLVQTTFIEAIRSCSRFRGEASLATWVTRIAVHVAQHQLRRGVRRMVPLEVLSNDDEPAARLPGPDALAVDRQLAARVHALLDRLSPKKRIAFLLFAVEGCSIAEVAALMDAGHAATKSRIWLARRDLVALAKKDRCLAEVIRSHGEPTS